MCIVIVLETTLFELGRQKGSEDIAATASISKFCSALACLIAVGNVAR